MNVTFYKNHRPNEVIITPKKENADYYSINGGKLRPISEFQEETPLEAPVINFETDEEKSKKRLKANKSGEEEPLMIPSTI